MINSLFPPSESNINPQQGLFPDRHRYLEKIVRSVHQGNCVRVLGPRNRGKSQILETAVSQLIEGKTHHAIYQSLKDLPMEQAFFTNLYRDVHLVNEADFFAGLFSRIQEKLEIRQRHKRHTFPQTAFAFQNELLSLVRMSERNIAIFIDDLETAPPNLVATLLGVLQSVFITLVDEPGAHFQAIVCGSLSFSQLTLENASHFEAISDLVYVADLSLNDCNALVENICYQADVTYDPTTAPFLMTQTGGDANLITQLLNMSIRQMGNADYQITPARLDEAIEAFLEEPPDKTTQETIEQIQSDANLLSCALRLLEHGQVRNNELPIPTNETPNPLDLCSAFLRFDGSYLIKCDIWQQLLIKHLAPAQIGGWYAVAGYWQESINYLGQAVADGNSEVQPELFAVIINAIHVSEESRQAYQYLGDGLQAAYPKTAIRLYRRDDQFLLPLYQSKEDFSTLEAVPISLSDLNQPEVKALDGPNYSLATVEGETYLLIPLRTGQARSYPIGLVVLGGLFTIYSPYQQRKDVLRFVEFLKQAARALLRAELLKRDKEQQDVLDRVANITPKISEQLDLQAVYTAVLEQIMQYIPAADYGCIVELDQERRLLRIVSGQKSYPIDQNGTDDYQAISAQERSGIVGRTIMEKRPFLINDVTQDADYISAISTTEAHISVPIPIQNRVSSALVLESKAVNAFKPSDQSLMEMVAKHAGIAIENARQFQDASNRQLRERTAMMATGLIHDINSAVAIIPDLVDELQDFIEEERDITKPLQDLEKSAMVTHRVSKRLRDFVVTGQHEVSWVELETLLQHAIEISENNHPAPVKTILNMSGLNPQIRVDRLWIELLLRNLLTNAYESFDENETDKLVTIDVEIDPTFYVINVQDNGKGIPQEIIDDVFSLGFTTKNSNRMHGVGLFHCRMIAEVHAGELTVESQNGNGTRFTLKLPR